MRGYVLVNFGEDVEVVLVPVFFGLAPGKQITITETFGAIHFL